MEPILEKLKLDFNSDVPLDEQKEEGMKYLREHCQDFIETAKSERAVRVEHALADFRLREEEKEAARLREEEDDRLARLREEKEQVSHVVVCLSCIAHTHTHRPFHSLTLQYVLQEKMREEEESRAAAAAARETAQKEREAKLAAELAREKEEEREEVCCIIVHCLLWILFTLTHVSNAQLNFYVST